MCCDCVRVCTGEGGRAGLKTGVATGVCVCVCGKYQCHYKGRVSLQLLIVMETCVGVSVGRGVLMCVCVCVCVSGWIPLLWSGQRHQGTLGLSSCPYGSSSSGTDRAHLIVSFHFLKESALISAVEQLYRTQKRVRARSLTFKPLLFLKCHFTKAYLIFFFFFNCILFFLKLCFQLTFPGYFNGLIIN